LVSNFNEKALNQSPLTNSLAWDAEQLLKFVETTIYAQNPKVKERIQQLVTDIQHYSVGAHPKRSQAAHPPSLPMEKKPTKQLKQMLRASYSNWINDDTKKIKEILRTREHVLTSAQSKLVRKMSSHAGKKLTLKESQTLSNNLKRKAKTST
jgi:hypothetical protein